MTQLEQYLFMLDDISQDYRKEIDDNTTDVVIYGEVTATSRFAFSNKSGRLLEVEVAVDTYEVGYYEQE